MNRTAISLITALVLIGGAFFLTQNNSKEESLIQKNNVTIVDGKQIVEISAKGGYQPRRSVAKPGIPTILRFNTNGTFDCSSSVRIPSMDVSRNLPPSGVTDIDLGIPTVAVLEGSCGMGMFPFEIEFQS